MVVPPHLQLVRDAAPNLCAFYRVLTVDRLTGGELCDLTEIGVNGTWHWGLNTTSEVELTVTLVDGCCECIPVPWQNLLVIERLGIDHQPEGIVWSGFVTQTLEDQLVGTLTVKASDRSIIWTRRDRTRVTITGTIDEADLWARLATDAETGDPSGIVIGPYTPTGAFVIATARAATATDIGTNNQDPLFGSTLPAVQWAVIDRDLYGPGPTTTGPAPWAELDVSHHWVDQAAVVDTDGDNVASQVRLFTVDEDDNQLVGEWPPTPSIDRRYGLHIRSYQSQNSYTQQQITAAARARYERDRDPYVFLVTSSDSLSPDAPVTVWDLIPGRRFTVTSEETCEQILGQPLEVYNVAVELADNGDGFAAEARVAADFATPGTNARSEDRVSI